MYRGCRFYHSHHSDSSAVRFVYRYVVYLNARFQVIISKLVPELLASQYLKSTIYVVLRVQ
jgi:hypothetical protein